MAGHDLTSAVQSVKESLKQVSPTIKYSWRLRTQWGVIRLSGGGDTVYEDEPSLITMDTGGNDTYINGPSNTSLANSDGCSWKPAKAKERWPPFDDVPHEWE